MSGGTPLESLIKARIRASGPIGFDEFMETALYDAEHGFYSRPDRGPGADYVTSVTTSPLFGATMARAVDLCHHALGRPSPFTLCEVGAGRGELAAEILGTAADAGHAWLADVEVVLVERGGPTPGAVRRLSEVRPFEGVLLANELLDNLPVRLRHGGEEVMVAVDGERLTLVPPAETYEVEPVGILRFLDDLSRVLLRGYAVLFDYGARHPGAVRTFAGHRLGEDVLEAPGEVDVTVSVDWDRVEREARARGFDALGRRTQRRVLVDLGLRASLEMLRAAESAAFGRQDVWEGLRFRDRQTRASALLDPEGLGGFEVLVLGRGVGPGLPWEEKWPERAIGGGAQDV